MKKLRITVEGKAYEVTVERLDEPGSTPAAVTPAGPPLAAPTVAHATAKRADSAPRPPIKTGSITSPMAGVVLSVNVNDDEEIEQEHLLLVLEAMKMENQIISPGKAKVMKVHVKAGQSVTEGQLLIELE